MSEMLFDGARIETDVDCVVTVRRREWHEAPYFSHDGTTWCWLEDGTPVGDAPGVVRIINDQSLTAQLDKLREENARLREALKAVEWTEFWDGSVECPQCGNSRRVGHKIACHLAAALAQSEDGP